MNINWWRYLFGFGFELDLLGILGFGTRFGGFEEHFALHFVVPPDLQLVELLEEFQLRLDVLVHLVARVRPHRLVAVLGDDGQLLQQRFQSLLRRVRYQRHHFRVCVAQPVLRSCNNTKITKNYSFSVFLI